MLIVVSPATGSVSKQIRSRPTSLPGAGASPWVSPMKRTDTFTGW